MTSVTYLRLLSQLKSYAQTLTKEPNFFFSEAELRSKAAGIYQDYSLGENGHEDLFLLNLKPLVMMMCRLGKGKLILTVLLIGNCPDKKSTEVHFWRRYLFEDMIA